jgi:hypothetical protein
MTFEVTATVALSDVLDAVTMSELLCDMDSDDILNEMDSDCVVSWVAVNHDHSVLTEIDHSNICSYVLKNVEMTELVDEMDEDNKGELRRILNEDAPASFSRDELVAIRDALTLVKAARASIRNTSTETIDNALEGVHRLIK